jgi:hypothetical protein
VEAVNRLLTGKHSHVLNLVVDRFPYLRQFALTLLEHLAFHLEEGAQSTLVEAARLLQEMNPVLLEEDPEGAGVDLSLLKHISPIGWENTILYGEYVLNRNLVRV